PQVIIEPTPLTTTTRKTAISETSTRAAIDLRIINKVLSIVQDNSVKLDQLSRHCAKLEYLIKEQQTQLRENAAQKLASDLFHNHEQISDEQIKERLKALLENNKECSEKLQKLKDKGVLFNKFWSKKLYSERLVAIQLKKGYYIRCVKEDGPNSETFLSLIIKYVFVSDDERTQANAI
ncbi:16085_t:CDS:2, partial [Dentiscutata heterogama]